MLIQMKSHLKSSWLNPLPKIKQNEHHPFKKTKKKKQLLVCVKVFSVPLQSILITT